MDASSCLSACQCRSSLSSAQSAAERLTVGESGTRVTEALHSVLDLERWRRLRQEPRRTAIALCSSVNVASKRRVTSAMAATANSPHHEERYAASPVVGPCHTLSPLLDRRTLCLAVALSLVLLRAGSTRSLAISSRPTGVARAHKSWRPRATARLRRGHPTTPAPQRPRATRPTLSRSKRVQAAGERPQRLPRPTRSVSALAVRSLFPVPSCCFGRSCSSLALLPLFPVSP